MSEHVSYIEAVTLLAILVNTALLVYCFVVLRKSQVIRSETLASVKMLQGYLSMAERERQDTAAVVEQKIKPQLDEMQQYQHKAKHDALDVAQTMISKLDVVERNMKSPPPGTMNVKDKPK